MSVSTDLLKFVVLAASCTPKETYSQQINYNLDQIKREISFNGVIPVRRVFSETGSPTFEAVQFLDESKFSINLDVARNLFKNVILAAECPLLAGFESKTEYFLDDFKGDFSFKGSVPIRPTVTADNNLVFEAVEFLDESKLSSINAVPGK